MQWRKQLDVDNFSEWEVPLIFKDYMPHGLSGYDKDGAPGKKFSFIIEARFDSCFFYIYEYI